LTKFRDGAKPYQVNHLVVAVACVVEDRKIYDEIDQWKLETGLDIELWDKEDC